MKKLLTASFLALATMAGSVVAAPILSLTNNMSPDTLQSDFNPTPPAAPYVAEGTGVSNATGAGQGLLLDGLANITFTYLGSEAGFTNLFFHGSELFSTGTTSGGSTRSFSNVGPGSGGFLDFKFISDGTQDVVNGNVGGGFSSIAFSVYNVSADGNTATVVAMLNDAFPGDADYDDMIVLITAERVVKGGEDVPLPAGALLLMSGLAGLGYMGRSRAAKKA